MRKDWDLVMRTSHAFLYFCLKSRAEYGEQIFYAFQKWKSVMESAISSRNADIVTAVNILVAVGTTSQHWGMINDDYAMPVDWSRVFHPSRNNLLDILVSMAIQLSTSSGKASLVLDMCHRLPILTYYLSRHRRRYHMVYFFCLSGGRVRPEISRKECCGTCLIIVPNFLKHFTANIF